jgi:major membrane immunogen (membrane-anchored lipoprotein)
MMHKNLQELDKSAFKSKQLKQEEKSSEAQAKLAMKISNVLAKQLGSRDIFEAKEVDVVEAAQIPNPTHLLGITQPVPGELKVGDDTSSYEEFSNIVGKALDEARKAGKAE